MAGDWIKMEMELSDKPEVHYIANALNLDPDAVVGKLFRVWCWFNKHTTDGNAVGVTYSLVDRISSVTGFGEAMAFAGWLAQQDKTLVMPNFDYHTSESAKKRALTAKRVANYKVKTNAKANADGVTNALPREEKRREDINTCAFDEFWDAYPKKKSRGQAEKAFSKLKADEQLLSRIISALEQAKTQPDWTKNGGEFIPYPATWLNAKGWLDEGLSAPQVEVDA